eukprot:GHRQ01020627.1.p1 GENE.GHRQ01020627.1~~GHRQ01020627.1.p1  ORF type:complete len:120 (-),score=4.34 GHRQ01020627.1:1186-1545(-)
MQSKTLAADPQLINSSADEEHATCRSLKQLCNIQIVKHEMLLGNSAWQSIRAQFLLAVDMLVVSIGGPAAFSYPPVRYTTASSICRCMHRNQGNTQHLLLPVPISSHRTPAQASCDCLN